MSASAGEPGKVKLLLIGDSGVGKSCLLLRFAEKTFATSFLTTIGIDFKTRTVDLDGEKLKLQMIIGNKCDLVDKQVIATARGQALADEYGVPFFETSAKDGRGVDPAFFAMAREVRAARVTTAGTVVLDDNNTRPGPSGPCIC